MFAPIIATVFAAIFAFKLIKVIKRKRQLPPGPIVWPLIGNLVEIARANPVFPHLAFSKLAKKYGNIMGLGIGMQYSVVLSGYEEIRDILKRPEAVERFEFAWAKDRSFGKLYGIGFACIEVWREMRPFTVHGLVEFGFGKKSSFDAILEEETKAVIQDIRKSTDGNNGVWDVETDYLGAVTLNVLWSLVTGERFDHDDEALQENLRLNGKVAKILGHDNIYNVYPFLKRLCPKLVQHDVHMQTHREMQEWMRLIKDMQRIVKQPSNIAGLVNKLKTKRSLRSDTNAQNFVELFLDEIEKNQGRASNFTEEQLIVVLLDLFFGGGENMSITLMWTILFLTLNPGVQRKLQKEICNAKSADNGNRITVQQAAKIQYLNAVILESLRMGMPAPLNWRMATKDFYYKNYLIPKGTPIHTNMEPTFMDNALWGDPRAFRPERFLDDNGVVMPEYADKVLAIFGFDGTATVATCGELYPYMLVIAIFENFYLNTIPGKEPSAKDPISRITIRPRSYSVRVLPNVIH